MVDTPRKFLRFWLITSTLYAVILFLPFNDYLYTLLQFQSSYIPNEITVILIRVLVTLAWILLTAMIGLLTTIALWTMIKIDWLFVRASSENKNPASSKRAIIGLIFIALIFLALSFIVPYLTGILQQAGPV